MTRKKAASNSNNLQSPSFVEIGEPLDLDKITGGSAILGRNASLVSTGSPPPGESPGVINRGDSLVNEATEFDFPVKGI